MFAITYVLFASWTRVASHSSTLCTIGWEITATSFQPFLHTHSMKRMPLYHFWQQMTGLRLDTVSFFNRPWDHTGEKLALSKEHLVFSLSPAYLSPSPYLYKKINKYPVFGCCPQMIYVETKNPPHLISFPFLKKNTDFFFFLSCSMHWT